MAWLSQESKSILVHLIGNFVAAAVLFAVSIGLGYVEEWCKLKQLPEHLCTGVSIVSYVLFVIDGIVICGAAAIAAIKLLKRSWKNDKAS